MVVSKKTKCLKNQQLKTSALTYVIAMFLPLAGLAITEFGLFFVQVRCQEFGSKNYGLSTKIIVIGYMLKQ